MSTSTPAEPESLPTLPHIPLTALPSLAPPRPRIRTENDLIRWRSMASYKHIQLFLARLNDAAVDIPLGDDEAIGVPSGATAGLLKFLDSVESIVERTPPLPTPQRYGNLAFRTFGRELSSSLPSLLTTLLPPSLHAAIPLLTPHLLSSFGNFTRMDYGTGHELSFLLFLLSLVLLRFIAPTLQEERQVALLVFPRYITICWKIQDTYRLEPAGSHGVWGLDDYHFIPYILGSAQLLHSPSFPSYILSLPRTPTPASSPSNMYELLIYRVHALKTGPFAEHSPQLHSIASGVPNWGKVNRGLRKMYVAEVLDKRVVVQHLALGGLLAWDGPDEQGPEAEPREGSPADLDSQATRGDMDVVTAAPWATPARKTFPMTWSTSLPTTAISNNNTSATPRSARPSGQTKFPVDNTSFGTVAPPSAVHSSAALPPPPRISAGRTSVKNGWGA